MGIFGLGDDVKKVQVKDGDAKTEDVKSTADDKAKRDAKKDAGQCEFC